MTAHLCVQRPLTAPYAFNQFFLDQSSCSTHMRFELHSQSLAIATPTRDCCSALAVALRAGWARVSLPRILLWLIYSAGGLCTLYRRFPGETCHIPILASLNPFQFETTPITPFHFAFGFLSNIPFSVIFSHLVHLVCALYLFSLPNYFLAWHIRLWLADPKCMLWIITPWLPLSKLSMVKYLMQLIILPSSAKKSSNRTVIDKNSSHPTGTFCQNRNSVCFRVS